MSASVWRGVMPSYRIRNFYVRMSRRIVRIALCLASLTAGMIEINAQDRSPASQSPPASSALTLAEALAKGLAHHPALAPYAWEITAREAAIKQADRPLNPSLGLEVEDIAGTGAYGGARQAQSTLSISQPLELGGKRALRTGVASAARTQAELELEFQQQEVLFQIRSSFVSVLVAQEKQRLLAEGLKLAEEVVATVQAKVEAGKVSPVELVKAQAGQASALKDWELAKQELAAARNQLAWTWGDAASAFTSVQGDLQSLSPVPARAECQGQLLTNAAVRGMEATLTRSGAELKLVQKSRLPDVTVSAGYRHINASEDHALLFGASVPLPVFQRQRGAEAEAAARLEKARAEEVALKHRLQGALFGQLAVLERTRAEAVSYEQQLLPSAVEVFDKTREGYAGGKFAYLDLLDSQRMLLKLRLEHIDTLHRHHLARAELDRLLGINPISLK